MLRVSVVVFLILSIFIYELMACGCDEDSSSSSSDCGCRKRHHRHHRHRCCCESAEAPTTEMPTTVLSCDKTSIDLVFVVDASGSVGPENFAKTLQALVHIVQNISIGPNDDQSHVGYVSFDHEATKIFGLADHLDDASVQAAISQVPYTMGGTFIEYGMTMATDQVFDQAGDRPNSPDIMLVITDGQDSSNVATAQQAAAAKGITVFAVGVGDAVDYAQLVAVAGTPARTYNATNFDFLAQVLEDICDNLGSLSNASPMPAASMKIMRTRVAASQQGNCDYAAMKKQMPDFTKEEFCRARPYCSKNC